MYQIIGKQKGLFTDEKTGVSRPYYALYVTTPMTEQEGEKEAFGSRCDRLKCTADLYLQLMPSDFNQDVDILYDRYGRAVHVDFA